LHLDTETPESRRWMKWWIAAAVLCAVGFLVGSTWVRSRHNDVDLLLTQAYVERRSLELRFGAARYAPMRSERSAARDHAGLPDAQMEAHLLIAQRRRDHPEDPKWLAAQGRLELLEWNFEAAIDHLAAAGAALPDDPDIQVDLASAFYERAEAGAKDRVGDYAQALHLLNRTLARHPGHQVALFNRAVLHERLSLDEQAAADWQLYLQLDRQGGWADEAHENLATLRQRMKKKLRKQGAKGGVSVRDSQVAGSLPIVGAGRAIGAVSQ
jgi:tetratricopeptide (TPR) repeat protein